MSMFYVDAARCTGCGQCILVCPTGAIILRNGRAHITQDLCKQCEACVRKCPEIAILSITESGEAAPCGITVSAGDTERTLTPREHATGALIGGALLTLGRVMLPRLLGWALNQFVRQPVIVDRGQNTAANAPHAQQHRHRHRRGG